MANTNKIYHNNRSFENWLRWLFRQPVLSGNMVSCSEETTYKCTGVGSSISYSETFSKGLERSEYSVRLNNCSTISEQTGGHQVSTDVLQNMGPLNWAIKNEIHIKSAHILGRKNQIADQLSRNKVLATEWTLNRTIVLRLFHLWGHPMIDLLPGCWFGFFPPWFLEWESFSDCAFS